jgi:hypothetical protein
MMVRSPEGPVAHRQRTETGCTSSLCMAVCLVTISSGVSSMSEHTGSQEWVQGLKADEVALTLLRLAVILG